MPVRTKPWTINDPPSPPVGDDWTNEEIRNCVSAANNTLENEGTDEEAIFACIGAAGKELEEKQMAETILIQTAKVLSHGDILDAFWDFVEGDLSTIDGPFNRPNFYIDADDVYDDYALVKGDGRAFRIPYTIENDEVVFGTPVEGSMEFVPKGIKKADPSWKCGAAKGLSINEDRSWDGSAAKGRIFSWAGWPDSPSSSKARRGFLAYDSANPELKGSYKLPFADVIDGELVAIRSGLSAAASRLPQTDISEGVESTARGVIDGYQAKFEKALAEGKEVGVAGAKTVFKIYEKDGEIRWLAVTSTAFKDREREFVSRAALDYSIGFSDITGFRGELNLYHLQNVVLGSCDFQYRVDKVLLEGGKWYDNEYANAVRNWVDKANEEGGESTGCSIEFFFDEVDRVDGVYSKVVIFNRAVVKRKHAANQYTWIGGDPENIRRKEMSSLEDLKDILGDELAEQALAAGGEHSKGVEGTGVESKGDDVEEGAATDAGDEPADDATTGDPEPKDKGADAEPAEDADPGEEAPEGSEDAGDESIKEIVFTDDSIKLIADAISKHLGIDELTETVGVLTDAMTVLARTDKERIEAKLGKVPKVVIRDSKKGHVNPVDEDDIVEPGSEEKSEEEQLAEAREKAYENW